MFGKSKRKHRKQEKTVSLIDSNYKKGCSIRYRIPLPNTDKGSTVILNYLNRIVPEPIGYSDESLLDKVEGVYRFDGLSLDLDSEKLIFRKYDLYLDLGFVDLIWLEPIWGGYDEYFKGYITKLKETGYKLTLEVEGGPYKVYDSVHQEMTFIDYPLSVYVTLTPLLVEKAV